MYRYMLPYNRHRDNSHVQGHNNTSDRGRLNRLSRMTQAPLVRTVKSGIRRANSALRRSVNSRSALPTMSWWD